MLKTGIYRPDLRALEAASPSRPISYLLLKDASPANRDSVRLFELIVKELRLTSGIYRTTYPDRFADLNAVVNTVLLDLYGGQPVEVHDWAASDGLATAEWAESLWKLQPAARFTSSDLLLELMAVSKGRETFVLEPDGSPLQYVRPPFVVSLHVPVPFFYPVNGWLGSQAKRRVEAVRQAVSEGASGWKAEAISLVHPRARALQASGKAFQIQTHSVFISMPGACQAIRTMNIFNLGYFAEPRLREGARCVFDSLVDGGVWIVGRTQGEQRPTRNSASIYQKTGGGFRLLHQLHGGSEIDPVIAKAFESAVIPL